MATLPLIIPPPCRYSTAGPRVALSLTYQRSRTSAPSTAVVWKSVDFTSVGMGCAAAVSAMMAWSTGRRDSTSPTGGGLTSAIAAAIGARAAATSGSSANANSGLLDSSGSPRRSNDETDVELWGMKRQHESGEHQEVVLGSASGLDPSEVDDGSVRPPEILE